MSRPHTLLAVLVALTVGSPGAAARVIGDADLEPIPLGPKDAEARSLISIGRWAEAAKRVTADGPGPRLVRGWLLERAGDHAGALAALEGVAEGLPLLADRVRVLRAEAWLALKRPETAAAEVAAVPDGSPLAARARRIRARALREAGEHDAARTTYEAIIASGDRDEVPVGLLGLARLEAETGHPERAVPLLRRVDVEFPTHWTAPLARREAEALVKGAPALAKAWADRSPAERLARAERLLDAHRNASAVELLEAMEAAGLGAAERCRQRYFLGRALRKLRRWKRARPVLDEAVALCAKVDIGLLPWARYLAGSAAEVLGAEEAAAAHFERLFRDHRGHRLADDGGFFLVRHHLEDRDDLDAARAVLRELVEGHAAGDMVPEAVFFVALHALQKGDRKQAREILALDRRLPPREPGERDAGRAAYWRARLDLDDGRKGRARAGFASVIATYPFSWYALMAYGRLREMDRDFARRVAREALTRVTPGPTLPGGDTDTWRLPVPARLPADALDRALLLIRLGLTEPAFEVLRDAGLGRDADDEVLWFTAWLLDRAGVHHHSHDILRRRLPVFRRFPPAGRLRKHWHLAYPRPFRPLVEAAARETGVERWFLWAVMREESGFNLGAESFANALGLMQLILLTAKRMAKKSEGPVDRARVLDPALNVRLGARYLRYLRDRHDAPYPLLPAGYNAGGGALGRWLRERGDRPLDLFVETIPYEETRWYTKRVTASWAVYRYLYGPATDDPLPYISQKLP